MFRYRVQCGVRRHRFSDGQSGFQHALPGSIHDQLLCLFCLLRHHEDAREGVGLRDAPHLPFLVPTGGPGVLADRFLFLYEKSGQVGGTFNLKERKMNKPWAR